MFSGKGYQLYILVVRDSKFLEFYSNISIFKQIEMTGRFEYEGSVFICMRSFLCMILNSYQNGMYFET